MHIEILIFDGFDELDAIGPYEVLRNATFAGADLRCDLVAVGGPREVTGAHELRVAVQGPPRGAADLILVPGGGWNDGLEHGVRAEVERGTIPALLAEAHAAGRAVGSVCTGTMLLAAAGLVRGRPASIHWSAREDLRAAGAEVRDERVVDAGDLVTAGGVTSGIDLALWLVEREHGRKLADGIAHFMEHERRGRVWLQETGTTKEAAHG